MNGFTKQDVELVNWIFRELQSIYPAWSKAFPDDNALKAAKRTWTISFVEQGVSDIKQVKAALNTARSDRSAFFPSVGRFISWCKQEQDMKARDAFNLLNVYRGGELDLLPEEVRATFDQIRKVDFMKKESDLYPIFKAQFEQVMELKRKGKSITHLIVPRLDDPNQGKLISEEQRLRVLNSIKKAKERFFNA